MILRLGVDGSGSQAGKGFDHQRRAGPRQHLEQPRGGLLGADFDRLLEENGAGVEAFLKQHGCVAGEGVAIGHGPLDGRGAAVLGQQRPVQIDAAQPGQRQHPGRKDAPVSHHNNGVGRDGLKLGAELRVAANLLRLCDRQSGGQRRLLHRRSGELLAAAHGPVGLCNHQCHLMARRKHCFKSGDSEAGRAAEDEFHRTPLTDASRSPSSPTLSAEENGKDGAPKQWGRVKEEKTGCAAIRSTICLRAASCESCAGSGRA